MPSTIPVIDFSPFRTGTAVDRQRIGRAIEQACRQVGFMYLTHHGIPKVAIAETFAQAQHFFSLPLETKQAVAWSSAASNRGYVGIERERLDAAQPGDLKEAFNIGREVPPDGVSPLGQGINQWPAGEESFRQTVSEFFTHCAETVAEIFRALAIALHLPETFLSDRHQSQNFTLRLLHYPPLTTTPKPGQSRAGAHTDYGTLTLLFQDGVGGLEVQTPEGNWVAAPAIPGAVLINIGDMTQRWSNDLLRSTRHRVGLPVGTAAGSDRYSIAYFCEPDPETEIACLPSCQSADNPPRYAPVKAGEYLLSRLQATY